jgi:CheY-specific phosphatase CheX
MALKDIEKQRQQEAKDDAAFRRSLVLAAGLATTIPLSSLKLGPLDRINQTVLSKVEDLKSKAISTIDSLASKLGIEGIETGNPTLPDLCPNQNILDEVYNIRQSLGADIEGVVKYITIIDTSLNIVAKLVDGQTTVINTLNLLKTATSLAAKFTPIIPGAVASALSDVDDLRTLITFTNEGEPKIKKLKTSLDNGLLFIGIASQSLLAIVELLKVIDLLLNKCGKKVDPINNDLLKNAQAAILSPTETSYQGFVFEIIEKPFNQTLNQKIGVAKNSQDIILLQTEPSFTTNPQVLINELKLIIDRDNLKAN